VDFLHVVVAELDGLLQVERLFWPGVAVGVGFVALGVQFGQFGREQLLDLLAVDLHFLEVILLVQGAPHLDHGQLLLLLLKLLPEFGGQTREGEFITGWFLLAVFLL
jgi:hypothetical protein